MIAAESWIALYARAELDVDDHEDGMAAPEQDSQLGRRYYYCVEEVDE